jgi:uncharacterized membrane protein
MTRDMAGIIMIYVLCGLGAVYIYNRPERRLTWKNDFKQMVVAVFWPIVVVVAVVAYIRRSRT